MAFTSTAMAQDALPDNLDDLEGVETGYGRMYTADLETLMASPEAMDSAINGEVPLVGLVGVFTFEDTAAAEDAIDRFGEEFSDEFFEGAEVEEVEIDDLGGTAYGYIGEAEVNEDLTAEMSVVVVQDDALIYLALVLGGTDSLEMSQSWVEFMMDGEIGDDDVVFNEDGTSTGGVFEVMPGEDDTDVTDGMLPLSDIDFSESDDEA